jgi:hypothetical protein
MVFGLRQVGLDRVLLPGGPLVGQEFIEARSGVVAAAGDQVAKISVHIQMMAFGRLGDRK